MNKATCISESVFSEALTRARKYDVLEIDDVKRQVKVRGDNKRIRWFPAHCFDLTGADVPTLRRIKITDTIDDPLADAIDVEVELSDGERRWCFFITPGQLASNGAFVEGTNVRLHYGVPHMIVVSQLSEYVIRKALQEIDGQGALIGCTQPLERSESEEDA